MNRVGEFQRFSHNDSLKAGTILIPWRVDREAPLDTGFTFRCSSTSSATPSAGWSNPSPDQISRHCVMRCPLQR
ncbi:hypothetical protein SynA1560_01459 [Synechococcus sp. A15-60]|nr:hypothetical protein SynA1560_01459 [Synechococcus sp. A15-60]